MRILLHTCCAPCMIHPYRVLTERGYEVVPFFYNPNIHPFSEYRQRYLAVLEYCESRGLELHTGPYEMERFFDEVSAGAMAVEPGGSTESRCSPCFGMRLTAAAVEARRLGIGDFTTTLLVSPYQDQELIREAGDSAAFAYGVLFHYEDMSTGFRDAQDDARRQGIYMQKYCGCVYSEKERYQKGDPPGR